MPKNSESFNRELEGWLRGQNIDKIATLDVNGEPVPSAEEADQFRFHYKNGSNDYGTVTVTTNGGKVSVFYNQSVIKDAERGVDSEWTKFLIKLKDWALRNGQMGFNVMNIDRIGSELKRRKKEIQDEKLLEGWYGSNKHTSWSDKTPSIKMIIKHNKALEEGDMRYHHIEKIFLENSLGERVLVPTKRPSIGRVFARHLAEGGQYNDERWNHIKEISEDVTKLSGFVRATRNGKFNESVELIVGQVFEEYQKLRENIKSMQSSRGYNTYFENWQPTLMETNATNELAEMFVSSTIDPRIEAALPILNKFNISLKEISEASEFEGWAQDIVEGRSPETDKKIEDLVKILSSGVLAVGPDAISIKGQLNDIIPDNSKRAELYKELEDSARADPDNNAAPAILAWLQKNRDEEFYGEVVDRVEKSGTKVSNVKSAVTPTISTTTVKTPQSKPTNQSSKPESPSIKNLMPKPLEEDDIVKGATVESITNSILNRIERTNPEVISRYGAEALYKTAEDVASFYEGTDELGTSDISIMVKSVLRRLEEDHGTGGIERIKSLSGLQ